MTNHYPFGKRETYIENEIKYLAQKFNITVVSLSREAEMTRVLPSNAKAVRIPRQTNFVIILQMLLNLFNPFFYNQLKRLKKDGEYSFKNAVKLLRAIESCNYIHKFLKANNIPKCGENTVLYSFWNNYETYSLIMRNKDLNNKAVVVSRAHRGDLYKVPDNNFYLPLKGILDEKLDRIYFISNHGLNYYKKEYAHCNDDKYCLMHLGTENDFGKCAVNNKEPFKIISCSNLFPVKRVDLTIEALSKIDNINIHWDMYGGGFLEQELKEKAKKLLDSKPNITYSFKGYFQNEIIHQVYRKSDYDLFLSTTESEGLPVSMMEAMSYGIPVASTDVDGVSDLVNNENGILFHKDFSADDIAKALTGFFELSPEKRLEKREKAYEKWFTCFKADVKYLPFADDMIGLINDKIY